MDRYTTMALCCSMNDQPWTAPVYYARSGYDLLFFSSPTSRHSQILAQNPQASAAIYGDYTDWKWIKGIQMEGVVNQVSSPVAFTQALATYVKRHPFVKEMMKDPRTLSSALLGKSSRVSLYIFHPRTIRYLDNSVGFGSRWMVEIREGMGISEPVLD
ncbi:MAG: pyridoxamine 5'-phosphate oxidase family protein [Desulfomonilaceae bacterium]